MERNPCEEFEYYKVFYLVVSGNMVNGYDDSMAETRSTAKVDIGRRKLYLSASPLIPHACGSYGLSCEKPLASLGVSKHRR